MESVADAGFPRRLAPTPNMGYEPIILTNFSQKLNEKKWNPVRLRLQIFHNLWIVWDFIEIAPCEQLQ